MPRINFGPGVVEALEALTPRHRAACNEILMDLATGKAEPVGYADIPNAFTVSADDVIVYVLMADEDEVDVLVIRPR